MTAREAAMVALGLEAVRDYERVKRFYMRYGLALEESFAVAVNGRRGRRGEPDVVTRLGVFEFQAAANTKNKDGAAAQRARVGPGRIVQATGTVGRGRISGVQFLELHGIANAERIAGECEIAALHDAKAAALNQQMRLV